MSTTDIPEADLVVIAKEGVIAIAKVWKKAIISYRVSGNDLHLINKAEDELLAAISLLEAREADKEHLEGKCSQGQ